LQQLIERALENGIDETIGEFDAQRMRTLNTGVLMITVVALVSMPVMTLVGRSETVPGTLLFLVLMGLVAWLQSRRRPLAAALILTAVGLTVVGLQSYALRRDFGVHFWFLALILFPLLFFPKSSKRTPLLLGFLITLSFAGFAILEQAATGYTDESLFTQILAAVVILGLSVTMRRQMVRAERGYDNHHARLEQQTDELRRHQEQLEQALSAADEARRILDRRVNERTADLQAAHDRLSLELRERSRVEGERRNLEAELHHAQRMESIGQLAGGIAHDFNNLLTVIGGNIDMALELKGAMTALQRSWLEEAQAATERAGTVTGQLLAYSRKQAVVLEDIEPGRVINGMRRMVERAAGEPIRVEMTISDSIGLVRLGKGQLEQVLMNLALNACDAMPHGGVLEIEASELAAAPASAASEEPDRPHLAVRVRDDGTGMDEATRKRVFDPFFTTKASGKGTGLGLSVTHGIVTGHEGHLEVESSPGQGSTFSLYLPIAPAMRAAETSGSRALQRATGKGETVLVVEDEPSVRRFTTSLLERIGYHVISCESGEQALELAMDYSGPIDLLLTDVVMPGLQGPELANDLLESRPEACVLFVSGYAEPERLLELSLTETRAFMPKPFSTDALAQQVRSLLDASPRPHSANP
jgi:signal transduction histidine kinase/ActR/RegA family two-component response regulator